MSLSAELVHTALLDCLSPHTEARRGAEARIATYQSARGFGAVLMQMLCEPSVNVGVRQMAAVVLRQAVVRDRWRVLDADEKGYIREHLVSALGDATRKIRSATADVVSSIARFDWPAEWPTLVPGLLTMATSGGGGGGGGSSSEAAVAGALYCLDMVVRGTAERDVLALQEPVLRQLLPLAQSGSTAAQLGALQVATPLVDAAGTAGLERGDAAHTGVAHALAPLLPPWLAVAGALLLRSDLAAVPLQHAALRLVSRALYHFPRLVEALAAPAPSAAELVQIVVGTLAAAGRAELLWRAMGGDASAGGGGGGGGGDDETAGAVESLVVQCFDVVRILLESRSEALFAQALRADLVAPLITAALQLMQMTPAQERAWSADPEEFVAQEDDMTSMGNVRAAGCDLLLDLFGCCADGERPELFAALVHAMWAPVASGDAASWRLRETALLAICCCREPLLEPRLGPQPFHAATALTALLTLLGAGPSGASVPSFLRGRAVCCVAALLPAATAAHLTSIAACVLGAFDAGHALPVRICGCRAFYSLLETLAEPHKRSVALQALGSSNLLGLLEDAGPSVLHLVVETVETAVRGAFAVTGTDEVGSSSSSSSGGSPPSDPATVERATVAATALVPIAVQMWSRAFDDQMLSSDLLKLTRTLSAADARCLASLNHAAPPLIGAIFATPAAQLPPTAMEGAMQLVLVLLDRLDRAAPLPDGISALVPALLGLLRVTDDRSAVQQGCLCLQRLLRLLLPRCAGATTLEQIAVAAAAERSSLAGAQLLSWHSADGLGLGGQCAAVVHRILRPELSEPAVMHAGLTASSVFQALTLPAASASGGGLDGGALVALVTLIASRLVASKMTTTRCGLVLALARLAHADAGGLLALLPRDAAAPVMAAWFECREGFERSSHRRVAALALLRVWDVCCGAVVAQRAAGSPTTSRLAMAAAPKPTGYAQALELASLDVEGTGVPWAVRALQVLLSEAESARTEGEEEEEDGSGGGGCGGEEGRWSPHPALEGLGLYPGGFDDDFGGGLGDAGDMGMGMGMGFDGDFGEEEDDEEEAARDVCFGDPLVACDLRWEVAKALQRHVPQLGRDLAGALSADERAAMTALLAIH